MQKKKQSVALQQIYALDHGQESMLLRVFLDAE